MKRKLLLVCHMSALILLFACEASTDEPIVWSDHESIAKEPNALLSSLINAYDQADQQIFTFQDAEDVWIELFVISSDVSGNFYKSLICQDRTEESGFGIEILIDLRSYFNSFRLGQRILLNPNNLAMQGEHGVYKLGRNTAYGLKSIPVQMLERQLIKTPEISSIKGRVIDLDKLHERAPNTLVKISGLQFGFSWLNKSFSAESSDQYDGVRSMEQCSNKMKINLLSSVYSSFKNRTLPEGLFEVEAVLVRDNWGQLALKIRTTDDFTLLDQARCDPIVLNCEKGGGEDQYQTILLEDFQDLTSTKSLENRHWLNTNAKGLPTVFRKRSERGNVFLQITGYQSEEEHLEVWLISPEINPEEYSSIVLSFESRAQYFEGNQLTVMISTDFERDPLEANWMELPARFSSGSVTGTLSKFIDSGEIELSCIDLPFRIGFRYSAADPGPSTTYDIDNILIRGLI